MNEILVWGQGWLGKRISDFLSCASEGGTVPGSTGLWYEAIQDVIDRVKPKAIINCSDMLVTSVDDCETYKSNTLNTYTLIPILFAEVALRNNIKFVNISTGCLYQYDYAKNDPITEDKSPDFYDLFFSRAAMYAEAALSSLGESTDILQLRIRMPLDYIPHKKNLMNKLLSFEKVTDVPNSITYVPDFLEALKHLLKEDAKGIFNVTNYGGLRFKELLEEYRKYFVNYNYAITTLSELKLTRTNLILSTDKLEETGFQVRDIHEVIPECISKYVDIIKGQDKSNPA